jgi:RNA-directed DNA polymerase
MRTTTEPTGHVGRHGSAVVNGPEGDALDWGSIDWAEVEGDVRRLRQRIFTASQAVHARDSNGSA